MTNQEKKELLERQLGRLEKMSERVEYAKALSGLTDTMLDVLDCMKKDELSAEGGAWQVLRELMDGLEIAQRQSWTLLSEVRDSPKGSGEAVQHAVQLLDLVNKLNEMSLKLAKLLGVPAEERGANRC